MLAIRSFPAVFAALEKWLLRLGKLFLWKRMKKPIHTTVRELCARSALKATKGSYSYCCPMPKETLVRILAFAILAIGTVSIEPATAQTYDPAYPVCLHVYTRGANYYECRYTSLPQCKASGSRFRA
jgi:hypothetical protein